MIQGYIDWFYTFVGDMIQWMNNMYIVDGVSLLAFLIAVAILCIVIGGVLIR